MAARNLCRIATSETTHGAVAQAATFWLCTRAGWTFAEAGASSWQFDSNERAMPENEAGAEGIVRQVRLQYGRRGSTRNSQIGSMMRYRMMMMRDRSVAWLVNYSAPN
jgi:hypothetical protein